MNILRAKMSFYSKLKRSKIDISGEKVNFLMLKLTYRSIIEKNTYKTILHFYQLFLRSLQAQNMKPWSERYS